MSVTVSPDLLEQARQGEVDDAAFTDCIRTSLPFAWQVISRLIEDLHTSGGEFADNQVPPPDEGARGQLLRVITVEEREVDEHGLAVLIQSDGQRLLHLIQKQGQLTVRLSGFHHGRAGCRG
jgi:hypothetical protein